jgi:hypothetical protein
MGKKTFVEPKPLHGGDYGMIKSRRIGKKLRIRMVKSTWVPDEPYMILVDTVSGVSHYSNGEIKLNVEKYGVKMMNPFKTYPDARTAWNHLKTVKDIEKKWPSIKKEIKEKK